MIIQAELVTPILDLCCQESGAANIDHEVSGETELPASQPSSKGAPKPSF